MTQQTLRLFILGLLLFGGIFHLALALLGSAPGFGWILTGSGVAYIALSFYVRRDSPKQTKKKPHGRAAIVMTILAAAAALGVGGAQYLSAGGPLALPIMFVIHIAIIAAGGAWLLKMRAQG
jgi:hypothetical protein